MSQYYVCGRTSAVKPVSTATLNYVKFHSEANLSVDVKIHFTQKDQQKQLTDRKKFEDRPETYLLIYHMSSNQYFSVVLPFPVSFVSPLDARRIGSKIIADFNHTEIEAGLS